MRKSGMLGGLKVFRALRVFQNGDKRHETEHK